MKGKSLDYYLGVGVLHGLDSWEICGSNNPILIDVDRIWWESLNNFLWVQASRINYNSTATPSCPRWSWLGLSPLANKTLEQTLILHLSKVNVRFFFPPCCINETSHSRDSWSKPWPPVRTARLTHWGKTQFLIEVIVEPIFCISNIHGLFWVWLGCWPHWEAISNLFFCQYFWVS